MSDFPAPEPPPDRVARELAHAIRGHLAAILNAVELIRLATAGNVTAARAADMIERQAAAIDELAATLGGRRSATEG